MKRKNRQKLLALLCMGAILTVGVGVGVSQSNVVNADDTVVLQDGITFESEYALGTELEIPTSTIIFNGESYTAECVLRYPDGNAFRGGKAKLDVAGKYVLEYRASTPSGIKSVCKEFNVFKEVFAVGSKSTAYYGTVEHASEKAGLVTSLAYGDKLVYNRVIDLNGNTQEDTIISLFVNPVEQGLADALNVVFVLTDAHDSENYVTITSKRLDRDPLEKGWQERNTYVTANAVGQPATGLERNGNGDFAWNGGSYTLHRNNIYGAGIKFSMAGIPNYTSNKDDVITDIGKPEDIATQELTFSMDYETRRVYMKDNNGGNYTIVADLDDVSIFPTEQWKGFTTGECYLSVYATSYNQSSFNCVITNIDGVNDTGFNAEYIVDGSAPELQLIQDEYPDGFPEAIVGRTYPVPKVKLLNDEKDVYLSTKVYRKDGKGGLINVSLKDGVFTPKKVGDYVVVYTAKDFAGNTDEIVYEVKASVSTKELRVKLNGNAANGITGELLTVPSATILDAQGNSQLKITAKLKDGDVSQEIAVDGENAYTFRPLHEGVWEIIYTYSDYLETKSRSIDVSVNKGEKPYIANEVTLPKYIIKGATYKLPVLTGYVFESGAPVETVCSVFIKDDAGTERALSGTALTSYAKEKATVIYRLTNGNAVSEKRYEVPVVDVGYDKVGGLKIADYFVGDNFTKEAQNDRIMIYTQKTGTQSFEFVNALQTFDFRTVFHISTAINKFQRVNIYLQDSENPDIEVKVSYKRNTAGNTLFTVNNGTTTYVATADFIESNSENFRLLYSNETRKISPSTAFGVTVEKDLKGNDFNGFPSQKVYMRVELEGITGKAGVEFLNINNQPMSMVSYDLLAPEISRNTETGKKTLGEEVVIKATYVADVLDPDVEFKMYVKTPSKEYAVSKDGVTLNEMASSLRDYELVLTEFGVYEVYYEAVDTNERRAIYSYVFEVVDKSAPTITLGGRITTANVGDTVVIADVSAVDNLSEKCTIFAKVIYPNGSMLSLPGNSFVATQAGEYVVWYFAYDELFNLSTASYVITVS